MASTLTTFSAFLKRRYTDKKVEDMRGKDRPLLGMITKDTNMDGESFTVPILDTHAQGVAGSTRAVSQTNATNVAGKKFVVTLGEYFGTVKIGDKAIKASRRNVASFLQNKMAEMDSLYDTMHDSMATYLYGNGGGSIGQVGSVSTNVITLADPTDAINFEVGMEIVLSENDGETATDALQDSGANSTVDAVDYAAGTITVTAAELTSLDADDYIFRQGDFNGDTGVVVLQGLQKQFTGGATPAALYGMTRTSNIVRLAGCYVPSATLTPLNNEQRLQTLGTYMAGRFRQPPPTTWFLHPENWQQISFSLQSRGQRSLTDSSTQFGYEALELLCGGKRVKLYSDPFCPKGKAFALSLPNLTLGSLGPLVHPIEEDGLTLLRAATTDDYEYRLKSYPAVYNNAPVKFGVVAMAS